MHPLRPVTFLALGISAVYAAGFRQITEPFGPNRNNLSFYVYEPLSLKIPAKTVVALHPCFSSAPDYFLNTLYSASADTYGYLVIYPSSTQPDGCFDVGSELTLQHNGGSDSLSVVEMVRYAVERLHADPEHVYVTGTESGGALAGVLAGAYPDVFGAAAIYGGAPFGCFAGAGDDFWDAACAAGQVTKSADQWGDLVRAAYPAYTGARPKIVLWHGTEDSRISFANYQQQLLQWSNVLGTDLSKNPTLNGYPRANYSLTIFDGGSIVGYPATGVDRVPVDVQDDLLWFGIAVHPLPVPPPSQTPAAGPQATSS
ncbi:alpha/beta-hydrolase [Exidia glandulosa HHB12029]|uniref:Carboxylic ester hydrolase n=1 Tax=Exidia glandulosa HHB12029 TaxID=1314781 RepID=A0A165B7A6_EXIGL|nr:alpha/beta-hydrolase [Exidia glandulosa HHB12029]